MKSRNTEATLMLFGQKLKTNFGFLWIKAELMVSGGSQGNSLEDTCPP